MMKRILTLATVVLLFCCVACNNKEVKPELSKGLLITSVVPLGGSPGEEVTITGQDFSNSANYNSVEFGDYAVVPSSSSKTQLIVQVPIDIADGSYPLSVKVNGETATFAQSFVVTGAGDGSDFVCNDKVPVTPEIVNKCFYGFGKVNTHPRLLYSAADIERIKNIGQTDPFAKGTYTNIITTANQVVSQPLLDYKLDGAGLRIQNIHEIGNNRVPFLVLAYQFTKDTKYALRCWEQLDKMTSFPDWGADRHFLDAGIAAKAVALAYDGLFDYLSVEQKQKLANAVRRFVLDPGVNQIQNNTGAWKWYLSNDNWNGIGHGGMIMAALAIYETDPQFMSKAISLAANGMLRYMQSLEPDGASEEGMMYWSYGLSNAFLAYESMQRTLSTTYGLTEQPGFQKTGWFPYQVSGPVGTATFGDDYLYNGISQKFLSYFWFANHQSDSELARTHYEACMKRNASLSVKMNGWMDLLFYNPDLVNAGTAASLALADEIKGVDYMYLNEKNDDDNSLYVGMHGGNNAASHGHLDAGTFLIQANGETWAVGNLGKPDPYPGDYFKTTSPDYLAASGSNANTPGRFYYYRVRTEAKSCLVFNPDARPEQNPQGKSSIVSSADDATGGYFVLDLTDCYSRDVSNYHRGIKLNRQTKIITIQDEFKTKNQSDVYWIMHSPATDGMMISNDGKRATMSKNGQTFYAVIKTPEGAVFEKVDRSESKIIYLPETEPIFSGIMDGKNPINKWYGKLQIKLSGLVTGSNHTIRVDFVEAANVSTPSLNVLNQWTSSN